MAELSSSVGLVLSHIAPLPDSVPDNAIIMLSGNIDPLPGQDVRADDGQEQVIVDWLRRTIRIRRGRSSWGWLDRRTVAIAARTSA
jgi:hypothetical protein